MPQRLVVIGGDAGGMAAASQARRRRDPQHLEIVALEKGRWTSYSACGIPYVVGGAVGDLDDLIARSPETFRDRFSIDARTGHRATAIDLDRGEVEVHVEEGADVYRLGFDVLHIATGAKPIRPDLPGIDDSHIHGVQTLEDAAELLDDVTSSATEDVVIVGGGYIGLELAEAFIERECPRVTVVEATSQLMRTLDADMAELVAEALRAKGVDVRLGVDVTGFGRRVVHTAAGDIDADLVILGIGVAPATELARAAGLETGVRDALVVDDHQRTSIESVWAAGDCCESRHIVLDRPVHIALGTVANKQGRVAGINIGGGDARFPGVVGTAVTKICHTEVARTGLSERESSEHGLTFAAATVESTTRAGYYPGARPIKVKLVGERGSGRFLGGQIVGGQGAAKRIDVLATALTARLSVADLIDLDLGYAPPFGPLWDPVQVAARELLDTL